MIVYPNCHMLSEAKLCQSLSGGVSVQGVSVQGVSVQGVSVQGISVLGVSVQRGVSVIETPHTVMSGQYASYWNIFLYCIRYFWNECHLITTCNKVGARICVYTCLWFCSQGGLPHCMLGYTPPPLLPTTGPEAGTTRDQRQAPNRDQRHPTGMQSCSEFIQNTASKSEKCCDLNLWHLYHMSSNTPLEVQTDVEIL